MNARFLPGSPIEKSVVGKSAKKLLLWNGSTSSRIMGLANDGMRYSHKL
jgi:hypothetical protein